MRLFMDIPVEVEGISGYKHPERPMSVKFGEKFKVIEILDKWRSPDGEFFKVKLANAKHRNIILTIYYNDRNSWMVKI